MEETVPKVKGAADVEIVGLMVSLDRMEVGKGGVKCALDEVHDLYGFETNAIVTMKEVIEHLYNKEYKGKVIIDDTFVFSAVGADVFPSGVSVSSSSGSGILRTTFESKGACPAII